MYADFFKQKDRLLAERGAADSTEDGWIELDEHCAFKYNHFPAMVTGALRKDADDAAKGWWEFFDDPLLTDPAKAVAKADDVTPEKPEA